MIRHPQLQLALALSLVSQKPFFGMEKIYHTHFCFGKFALRYDAMLACSRFLSRRSNLQERISVHCKECRAVAAEQKTERAINVNARCAASPMFASFDASLFPDLIKTQN